MQDALMHRIFLISTIRSFIFQRHEQCNHLFVAKFIHIYRCDHLLCTTHQIEEKEQQFMMMKSLRQVKKSKSYRLEKCSPEMEKHQFTAPSEQYSTGFVTKNSPPPTVEFPTSPQLIFGEEIVHLSHPQHPLSMVDLPDLFICVGCKEYGSGKRFVCQKCEFQMHDFCALAPPTLKAHPFHSQHSLFFHSKPGN